MGKNLKEFHKWQNVMESYGYTNFAKVLNSKDYGVPQNRERIFMVSILDCTKSYHFPEPFKLEKRIKDILEPYGTVDESFYFSAKQLTSMFDYCDKKKSEGCGFQTQFTDENGIASCVTTRYGASYTDAYLKEPSLQQRLSLYADNAQAGRVYDVEGISPCLDTCSGGNRMPKIIEPCILTPQRTEEAKELRRKGIEVFKHREFVPRKDGVSNTITTVTKDNLLQEPCILGYTRDDNGKVCDRHDKTVLKDDDGKGYLWQDGSLWRVRKLTGKEVFRLMDVSDEDIEKIQSYPFKSYAEREKAIKDATARNDKKELNRIKRESISKSAQYSLAGNSIVVQCLICIFENLFVPLQSRYNKSNHPIQLSLF